MVHKARLRIVRKKDKKHTRYSATKAMSQQARSNPDSEEYKRMTRENKRAVLYAQMDTWPTCVECKRIAPSTIGGLCSQCWDDMDERLENER